MSIELTMVYKFFKIFLFAYTVCRAFAAKKQDKIPAETAGILATLFIEFVFERFRGFE